MLGLVLGRTSIINSVCRVEGRTMGEGTLVQGHGPVPADRRAAFTLEPVYTTELHCHIMLCQMFV